MFPDQESNPQPLTLRANTDDDSLCFFFGGGAQLKVTDRVTVYKANNDRCARLAILLNTLNPVVTSSLIGPNINLVKRWAEFLVSTRRPTRKYQERSVIYHLASRNRQSELDSPYFTPFHTAYNVSPVGDVTMTPPIFAYSQWRQGKVLKECT